MFDRNDIICNKITFACITLNAESGLHLHIYNFVLDVHNMVFTYNANSCILHTHPEYML